MNLDYVKFVKRIYVENKHLRKLYHKNIYYRPCFAIFVKVPYFVQEKNICRSYSSCRDKH